MRKFILTAMLLLIPRSAAFAVALPIISVSSATINYNNNQVTFNGSGFEASKKSPTVLFAGSALTVVSYSNNGPQARRVRWGRKVLKARLVQRGRRVRRALRDCNGRKDHRGKPALAWR